MKRWRRPLMLIALLLLVGAVVNVGVAWALVGTPDSWRGEARVFQGFDSEAHVFASRVVWPQDWGDPVVGGMRSELGRALVGASAKWTADPVAVRIEAGWPHYSLGVDGIQARQAWISSSPSIPVSLRPGSRWFESPYDRLPLRPIPAGFAINTLFYTALLALPLSVFPIRRRLRARRGRCPKCGYDLAGLRGVAQKAEEAGAERGGEGAAPCPECGVAR